MSERWSVEQVAAVAPSRRALAAAETVAVASKWTALGSSERALWGRCDGSGSEPYVTMVDHIGAAWRCSCPSRKLPCKHALGLLLLWVRAGVPPADPTADVAGWITARDRRAAAALRATTPAPTGAAGATDSTDLPAGTHEHDGSATNAEIPPERDDADSDSPRDTSERDDFDQARNDRLERMLAGLDELDRWLEDRMRTGLSDPAIARYETWDGLAARLVDAQAGALANRVRRLAGLVGAAAQWHEEVLAELGLLHLLAQAGRRIGDLPGSLADAVALSSGWQVRQADVIAGVPATDEWFVAGRSDQREDRIEVRRWWLWGSSSGRWAMVLSFAAYQQSLDDSLRVGATLDADLHRYPGSALRSLIGRRADVTTGYTPVGRSIAAAVDEIGAAVAAEPWVERFPAVVCATPAVLNGRWVLTDDTGSLPLIGDQRGLATLVAAATEPLTITIEWTPHGVQPLTIHLADRTLDIGPTADASFVA